MKDSFIFYASFHQALRELPDKDQLRLYQAIAEYALTGVEPELDGVAKGMFSLIKPQINANNKRYVNGCKGAQFGKLGGRPKKNPESVEEKPRNNPEKTPNEPLENPENQKEKRKEPKEKNKNIYNPLSATNVAFPLIAAEDIIGAAGVMVKMPGKSAAGKKKSFMPPKIEEVAAYIREKNLCVDAEQFFTYFEAGDWIDSTGKPVRNWKQKLITWDDKGRKTRTLNAARELLNTGIISGTYGKDMPL